MNVAALVESLKRHEGYRSHPYRCPAGKLTIGYGRNLDDVGIGMGEAEALLLNDVDRAHHAAARVFGRFAYLNDARQNVLVEMAFQLGEGGLAGFRNFLDELAAEDFEAAAHQMLTSKWARQDSPARARELAAIMRTGVLS